MLRAHSISPGPPVTVSLELGRDDIAACAHAARVTRERRFRTHDLSTDDVLVLRELTALVDALDVKASHGADDTVFLTAARLMLLGDAVRELADTPADHHRLDEETSARLRTAAELVDPLTLLAREAMNSAFDEAEDPFELDEDDLSRLLDGE